MSEFYTLTHSNAVQGWTSFYSFNPDWMIGMNQYFYTFKQGNLYIHNKNANRNTFYGTYTPSSITFPINDMPIDNKLFKTLSIEGDSAWAAQIESDIQDSGFIEAAWYEKKEGSYFAFVRNSGQAPAELSEYALRSVNGIGRSTAVSGVPTAPIIEFSTAINIGSIISVGDLIYFAVPPYSSPQLAGRVTGFNIDLPNGNNQILVDATIPNAVTPIPLVDCYFMFIKDAVAESHGILGHYAIVELTNNSITPIEMFVVNSEVMKSYP